MMRSEGFDEELVLEVDVERDEAAMKIRCCVLESMMMMVVMHSKTQ